MARSFAADVFTVCYSFCQVPRALYPRLTWTVPDRVWNARGPCCPSVEERRRSPDPHTGRRPRPRGHPSSVRNATARARDLRGTTHHAPDSQRADGPRIKREAGRVCRRGNAGSQSRTTPGAAKAGNRRGSRQSPPVDTGSRCRCRCRCSPDACCALLCFVTPHPAGPAPARFACCRPLLPSAACSCRPPSCRHGLAGLPAAVAGMPAAGVSQAGRQPACGRHRQAQAPGSPRRTRPICIETEPDFYPNRRHMAGIAPEQALYGRFRTLAAALRACRWDAAAGSRQPLTGPLRDAGGAVI